MLIKEKDSSKNCIPPNKILWEKASQDLLSTLHTCKDIIHSAYFEGLEFLGLSTSSPPTLEELNKKLGTIGWKTFSIDKFVFAEDFAYLQSQKTIPICFSIRGEENKKHSVSPDFIHSVFGHLPLLFWEPYQNFIETWAAAMMEAHVYPTNRELHRLNEELIAVKENNPNNVKDQNILEHSIQQKRKEVNQSAKDFSLLDMLYVRSLEFGILGTPDKPKIIGAAVLSSKQELLNILHKKVPLLPFSQMCLIENIEYIKPQERFYITQNFCDYYQYL